MNNQNEQQPKAEAQRAAEPNQKFAKCGNCSERIPMTADTERNHAVFLAHQQECTRLQEARAQVPQLLAEWERERRNFDSPAEIAFRKYSEKEDNRSMSRTDRNNNPAAFTTDIARQAGLIEGTDYIPGDLFPPPSKLVTAKLIGDPRPITIRVIDRIGYYTADGRPRWEYIALPKFVWDGLSDSEKVQVIGYHYHREGGTALAPLFGTSRLEF